VTQPFTKQVSALIFCGNHDPLKLPICFLFFVFCFPFKQTMVDSVDNIRMAGYMEKQPVRGSMKRVRHFSLK